MTEADAIALTSSANPLTTYAVNLKLSNPDDAQAFAYDRFARTNSATAPVFSTWQGLASEDGKLIQDGQGVLRAGGVPPRAARDRQRGRARRTPAVGVRTPGRAAEGSRRHAERRRGDLPRRKPGARAVRRGGRPRGRLARGAADHQARCGPHRDRGRGPALAGHRGAGHRAGDRGVARGDARPRHPRVARQHGRGAQRRRPPAEAPGRPGAHLEQAADPGAVRAPAGRAPPPPFAPQRGKRRRHHNRHRGGDRIPRLCGQQAVRSRRFDWGRAVQSRWSTATSRCSRSSRSCWSPSPR